MHNSLQKHTEDQSYIYSYCVFAFGIRMTCNIDATLFQVIVCSWCWHQRLLRFASYCCWLITGEASVAVILLNAASSLLSQNMNRSNPTYIGSCGSKLYSSWHMYHSMLKKNQTNLQISSFFQVNRVKIQTLFPIRLMPFFFHPCSVRLHACNIHQRYSPGIRKEALTSSTKRTPLVAQPMREIVKLIANGERVYSLQPISFWVTLCVIWDSTKIKKENKLAIFVFSHLYVVPIVTCCDSKLSC